MSDNAVTYAHRPWLRHYPEQVPPELDYPDISLADALQETAEKYGDREAMVFFGSATTYRRLLDRTRRLAGSLARLGVKKGDRVAIMLPNCPQAVISYYAVLWLGAIVVMVNPLYTARELEEQMKDSGATHIIAFDWVWPRVKEAMPRTSLKEAIITSLRDYMPFPLNLLFPIKARRDGMNMKVDYGENVHRFLTLAAGEPAGPPAPVDTKKDLALLQYTGGTTGVPKGVMLTHFNLVSNCVQIQHWMYRLRDKSFRVMAALPFFHVYGLTTVLNFAVFSGSSMVITPRFTPEDTAKLVQKYKPTVFPGAPTMYIGMNSLPNVEKFDLGSVEACVSGAAPLPVEVQETFERLTGGRLVEGYGLTEASPVTHANPLWDRRKNGSIGLPWPDTEARIVDEEGREVPVGEEGELIVKGPQVMQGYWNSPEETEAALKDGWLYTGDAARMDEEGYFYIVDRLKDVIIAGGFNVYPREVEDVLFEHPAVAEAAVVGVPDEYRGETVKAFIVLKEGQQATAEDIESFARKHLAAYKVPRLVEFRDDLPKTLVGKVLRRVLLEEELAKD